MPLQLLFNVYNAIEKRIKRTIKKNLNRNRAQETSKKNHVEMSRRSGETLEHGECGHIVKRNINGAPTIRKVWV